MCYIDYQPFVADAKYRVPTMQNRLGNFPLICNSIDVREWGRGGGINGEHSVIPLKLQSAPHHILRKGLVCF